MTKKRNIAGSKLASLSSKLIEEITLEAEEKKDIPLVHSQQVNMRVKAEFLAKAKILAKSQGKPLTTFLSALLYEDIERLWSVFKKVRG